MTVLRVCSFESRRQQQMSSLIERHGGAPTVAPSMREAPLERQAHVFEFWDRLLGGDVQYVLFLTGVGARALLETLAAQRPREELLEALQRCTIIIRGPKPQAVLREWGVRIDFRAPEPNTWREVLATIDEARVPLAGRTIAVQEYGKPNPELYTGLEHRGARVLPVPVYRWELPEDVGPLRQAVAATLENRFDVLLFTSAQQAHHVLHVAEQMGRGSDWLAAARRCVVGSIGPTATETLIELGLPPDCEPDHPKMGPLVAETLAAAPAILPRKRSGA